MTAYLCCKTHLARTIGCVITYILIVTAVLAPVNILLVAERDQCWQDEINRKVLARVVGLQHGVITYGLLDSNCSVELTSRDYIPLGTEVWIYRNELGQCAHTSQDLDCNGNLVLFNVLCVPLVHISLVTLLRIWYGPLQPCEQSMCSPCVVEGSEVSTVGRMHP